MWSESRSKAFVGCTVIGSLAMALVATYSPITVQIAVLGSFISILGGLFLSYMEQEETREQKRQELLGQLAVPLALSQDPELYKHFQAICKGLTSFAGQTDPILRDVASLKLGSVVADVEQLATGRIIYSGTESWRTVYEKLLASPELKTYQSVALVRGKDYWQDPPGLQSIKANFDAAHRGVLIERIIVLRDELWPIGEQLPVESIRPWIEEQHNHGLWITLVRESALLQEPDLFCDFGIYGERAVGVQDLDERCRTIRFELSFDERSVKQFTDRWQRLSLFGTSYRKILDREHAGH